MERFGAGTVLGDIPVVYMRCAVCRCVQLPGPDWLDAAYADAISALDVGLLERCVQLANVTTAVLGAERLRSGTYLDFAGGYGTLTRFMRDRGFDFHHHDPLCQNLFAQGWEGSLDVGYDLVTAFEVLEHLVDPVSTLAPVAGTTDLLLLTTQVLPEPAPAPGEWDYSAAETGQHVTLYTPAGLRALAEGLGMDVTSSGRVVHLFHRRPLRRTTRLLLRDERIGYAVGALRSEFARRRGLITSDGRAAVDRLRARRP
jgi:hypothetical protein